MRRPLLILTAILACLVLTLAGPAFAQYPPEVEADVEAVEEEVAREGLPFTGANLALFAFAGVVAVGTGTFIVTRARRR